MASPPATASARSRAPRTAPDHELTGWPPGVPYIIGNEGCERFSYYGMRAILTVFLADTLYRAHPDFGENSKEFAQAHYHVFAGAVYFFPLLGAVVADRLLGKYRTILWLSCVYVAGHAMLALFEDSVTGFWIGLGLIAIGSGGIKPCVSAHVGDQFGRGNWFRVKTIFQGFYFIINLGSFSATLLIPELLERFGPGVAFGVPGVLMAIATLCFWLGRHAFVHVPPQPGGSLGGLDALSSGCFVIAFGLLFVPAMVPGVAWYWLVGGGVVLVGAGLGVFSFRQSLRPDDGFLAVLFYSVRCWFTREAQASGDANRELALPADAALAHPDPKIAERRRKLAESRLFGPAVRRFGIEAAEGPPAVLRIVSVFFLVSVFWALFDQHGSSWVLQAQKMNLDLFGYPVKASQIASLNPLMVMLLIPFTNLVVYPGMEKLGFIMTPLRRMTVGMFVASLSFVAVALIQQAIDAEGAGRVHFSWQVIPYIVITVAEVMVSITGLEFAYTQAPKRMKSTVMGFWLATVSVGNLLVSLLTVFAQLPPAAYFWTFAGLMAVAAVIFGVRALFYTSQEYVQD